MIRRDIIKRTILLIGNRNRIVFFQIYHLSPVHIDAWNPVCGCRKDKGFFKSKILRDQINLPVSVDLRAAVVQSKMPFPYNSCTVSSLLKEPRHCLCSRLYNALGIPGQNVRPIVPERITSGQQTVARRRTYRRIRIIKFQPLIAESIHIRRS